MTDAEIIKALECCSQEIYDCDACPFNLKEEELCFIEVRKYALDLINRQKAEIDFAISSRKLAEAAANTLKTEFEVSKAFHREAVCERDLLSIQLKKARAEAIKEFAERLKTDFGEFVYYGDIDNLVKEMAGDMK